MLQVGVISVVFYSLSTLSNGILQGVNRMKLPVINAGIALALQAGLLYALMKLLDLNIFAVIWANTFFAFAMCVLNGIGIYRSTGFHQEVKKTFLLPALCAGIMGVIVYVVYMGLQLLLKINALSTLAAIAVGGASYFVLMLALKGLNEEDLLSFPAGRKLISLGRRLHLL